MISDGDKAGPMAGCLSLLIGTYMPYCSGDEIFLHCHPSTMTMIRRADERATSKGESASDTLGLIIVEHDDMMPGTIMLYPRADNVDYPKMQPAE